MSEGKSHDEQIAANVRQCDRGDEHEPHKWGDYHCLGVVRWSTKCSAEPLQSVQSAAYAHPIYPAWTAETCWNCGGHGVVSVYSHNDFEGAGECGTCGGSGQLWRSPKGRLAMYPGGPFRGS